MSTERCKAASGASRNRSAPAVVPSAATTAGLDQAFPRPAGRIILPWRAKRLDVGMARARMYPAGRVDRLDRNPGRAPCGPAPAVVLEHSDRLHQPPSFWQAPAALQFPRKCLAGRAIRKRAQGRQGRYNQRLAQAAQGSGLRPHRAALMRRLARVRHSACPHQRIRSHALWLCAIGRPLPGQSLTAAAPGSADLAARGCRTGSEPDRHPPRGRPTGAEVLPRRPPGG